MWVEIIAYILFMLITIYVVLMVILYFGWNKLRGFHGVEQNEIWSVSVIIATRNEEANIGKLLRDLYNQKFPKHRFEVLVIDDHSEDNTFSLIEEFQKANVNFPLRLLKSQGKGKKAAIRHGVESARFPLILTTDADCQLPRTWIQTYAFSCSGDQVLWLGPVVQKPVSGTWQRFFALDFLSLVASSAGAAGAGFPFMGNGANMAFMRDFYLSSSRDLSYNKYVSGDDVFLIHEAIASHGPGAVAYLPFREGLVSTPPPTGVFAFMQQRLRWASKSKGYKLWYAAAVALLVLLVNLLIIFLIIMGTMHPWMWVITFVVMFTKALAEAPLVYSFASFSGQRELVRWFVPFSLVYPFYVAAVGLAALPGKFRWKDRRYRDQ